MDVNVKVVDVLFSLDRLTGRFAQNGAQFRGSLLPLRTRHSFGSDDKLAFG
jgi:hypothetical protein